MHLSLSSRWFSFYKSVHPSANAEQHLTRTPTATLGKKLMSTGKARSIELKARSKPQYMGESRLPRLMDRQQKVMFVTQLLQSILGTVRWFSETMQQQTWDGMRTSRRFTEVRKVGYGMIPSHLGLIVRRTYTWKSSSLRPSDRQATFRWDLQLTLWQSNVCPATQDVCDANPGTYAENQECSNFRLRGFPAWEDLKYLSTWAVSSSRQTSDLFCSILVKTCMI